ncbi:hypothetical protein [Thermosphaera sp.]
MFFTLFALISPLAVFIMDVSSSNGEIIGIEPVRDNSYCGLKVSYEGNVKLVGFTLWMNQTKIDVGDLEQGSVKTVTVECDVLSEPSKISFTIAGLYPLEIRLNTTSE